MIVAISAKINGGKDLVGEIIRYLTRGEDCSLVHSPKKFKKDLRVYHPNEVIQSFGTLRGINSDWQIKKFADKLKDIVCMLIGCTRKELEDEEFKNKELGEEWKVYYTRHKSGSIIHRYNLYSTEAEAEAFLADMMFGKDFEVTSELLTPRKLFTLIGTDGGRNIVHPNMWINALFSTYKPEGSDRNGFIKTGNITWQPMTLLEIGYFPKWIITDLRFPNELAAVKARHGITIRVNRYNTVQTLEGHPQHESETALDDAEFDYTIDNDGTIEELVEKVRVILVKERII